ncbi:unnamed protein product [Microthlaspi erraticum]|uniref:Protein kinase domain-containing protein n=1 Tax=Microthlaspi erraticum TaxID=1685480 RepID=A0A6D2JM03_9BRAS|nr:unnamed protein product [Microthlaspi erraticum]
MAERFPLMFLIATHFFISGVLSTSILTIENKCNHTVWPVIYSWQSASQLSTTGFVLRRGEARDIHASSWNGLISGRTLCSNDTAGNFTCITGDCGSGKIECPGDYHWSPVTYIYFKIDDDGINSYYISLEFGYNLPLSVVPSQSSQTCRSYGCMVDVNQTCPDDLKIFAGAKQMSCISACQEFDTPETCCTRDFKSKQKCKPTLYLRNFERACPLAYSYPYSDNNSTFVCPNSTDFIITFCPSSVPKTTRSSMVPVEGRKYDSLRNLKPILGGLSALAALITILAVMVRVNNMQRNRDSNDKNIEAVVMLKRYSYKKVKKMTNSFDHVLGKGGFGTVYKGKLPDASGQDIALKILDDSKGNGEDFINELASMSIASHVNIVPLFGFCYEGSKRAIIYEFMPNGSLDKFISEDVPTKKMDRNILYNIAVGVARGLEYLHNSCVSKIVHFDIKPQNILLDEDFCPKISDFGLAKLCKKNDSIISMLYARGTAGYIAPEVFSKSYGGVSHKSDVYSYGMVVLELIGATSKERGETSRSNISTMYFPDWIYEDLEKKETMRQLGDHMIDEEENTVKKMTLVGLWCIQTNPCDRPPM